MEDKSFTTEKTKAPTEDSTDGNATIEKSTEVSLEDDAS